MASHQDAGPAEKINTDIVTLTRFLTEEQTKYKEATGDFTYVLIDDLRLDTVCLPQSCPS